MCHGCVVEGDSVSKEKIVLDAFLVQHSKIWEAKDWVFLCNSVLGNQTSVMQMQLTTCDTFVLPHPPACLYMKDHLKSFHFMDAGEV
jgi:hypothetical protein